MENPKKKVKTLTDARYNYFSGMRTAFRKDKYAKKMSKFLDIDIDKIKKSEPVVNWNEKLDTDKKIDELAKFWASKFKQAYQV